jgi:hypothetical protein
MRRFSRPAAVALLVVAMSFPALAIEERPLPAFSVTRVDGAAVASTDLIAAPQYVLMYLAPNCRPCDSLLALARDAQTPQFASRTVVLVRADAKGAGDYVAQHTPADAGPVTWYADANDQAFKALRLTGTPVLIGVRQGRVIWSISGVLNDASTVQSVVRTWVTY